MSLEVGMGKGLLGESGEQSGWHVVRRVSDSTSSLAVARAVLLLLRSETQRQASHTYHD